MAFQTFAQFLHRECGVEGYESWDALGKLIADVIVKKADEAGDYYVHEACVAGYFS